MKQLIFKLSASLLMFAIGIAASAGWRFLRRSSASVAAVLVPRVTAQEAEMGTLAWYVQQAKAKGQTSVDISSIGCGMGVQGLDFSLSHYSLVVAQPVEQRVYADKDHIVTWYKFKIAETLNAKAPTKFWGKQLADIQIPADLLPVGADEMVMARTGGSMVIDGVTVNYYSNSPKFSLSEKYLLFLEFDAGRRFAFVPWSDRVGIFKLNGDDEITAVYDDGSYNLKDKLRARFHNSLTRLREFLARRASQNRTARGR